MCDVNIATGEVSQHFVDLYLPGIIPVHFVRTYSSKGLSAGSLGYGWKHNLALRIVQSGSELTLTGYGNTDIQVPLPLQPGAHDETSGLAFSVREDFLVLREADGSELVFHRPVRSSLVWHLAYKQDAYGNRLAFTTNRDGLPTSIIDTVGRLIDLTYDVAQRLTQLRVGLSRDKLRAIAVYGYDAQGDLATVTDATGVPYRFEYDGHFLVRTTNRVGGSTYFQYDERDRCIRSWMDNGVLYREIAHYDARRTVAVKDSRGYITVYRNNAMGLTEEEVNPLGIVRKDAFDANGRSILTTSASGGGQAVTTRDAHSGVFTVTSASGSTRFELGPLGKPIAITTPGGRVFKYEYDRGGNVTRSIDPLGSEWCFTYDEQGYLTSARDPLGFETRQRRAGHFRVELEDDMAPIATFSYDVMGNPVSVADALGRTTKISYDASGRVSGFTFPDGSSTAYGYDAQGNTTEYRDETGLVTTYRYDAYGTLLQLVDPLGRTLSQRYDTEENLVEIRNFKGERATIDYDAAGRVSRVTYFDGRIECAICDDDDNVIAVTNAAGDVQVRYEYDAGRMTRKLYADGTDIRISYGAECEIQAVSRGSATTTFEWDAAMRIMRETQGATTIEYTYDALGNRTSLRSDTGRVVHYQWDARRRLTRMVDSGTHEYAYRHNAVNLVTESTLPGGTRTRFSYDSANRMIERTVFARSRADGAVAQRTFHYDAAGRLVRAVDAARGTDEFRYDAGDRLLQRTNGSEIERYEYDDEDNIVRFPDGSAAAVAAGNRLMSKGGIRFEYDQAGNTVARHDANGTTRFSYVGEGELASVVQPDGSTTEFEYDAFGRRTCKRVGGHITRYLWDGMVLLQEDDDTARMDYLFLPESFFPAGVTHEGEHRSYAFDQLATPTELLDVAGVPTHLNDLTAFGAARGPGAAGPQFDRLRFQGQYFDGETGLSYNLSRYYDSSLGRFISQDPIGWDGGPNLYRYVPNPVNWVDPLGLVVCEITFKCSWSDKQKKDAQKKMAAMNAQIGTGVPIPNSIPSGCAARKNAKDIYDKCRKNGHPLPALNETSSKCSNEQADHILEVCAGGKETDCNNLQPLNQSVNASFGSQMANCVKANLGGKLTGIRPKKGPCKPGGRKCP